jgi:signal peptidase II
VLRKNIALDEQISVINPYFTLIKVENSGAFLSDTLAAPVKSALLLILPIIVLGYGLFFMVTKKNLSNLTLTGLCFIMGGGIGNIYDRVLYGSVTDFMHIDFVIFQTGIFNMADVSIMVGMGMLVVQSFYKKKDITVTDHIV